MIDQQTALIYAMVLAAAADSSMTDAELGRINEMIGHLPSFAGFDIGRLGDIDRACAELLSKEDGLDQACVQIRDALPERLRETAYALACDVVAVDTDANQEELRMLELMRHVLDIDRLIAAGIERGAAARYTKL